MSELATAGPPSVPGRHPAWLLLFAGLLGWHAWMSLGLFDAQNSLWQRLTDDQPVLTGRHPLHLYHGHLGAAALLERGSLSCYDPAFHAGYPKTPVFDGSSRPAELALALGGGKYSPQAYKIGLLAVCLVAPLFVFAAARGAGLSRGVASLAVAFALLAWWGRPGREALDAGDVDLLLSALACLGQLGLLLRYHERPGVLALLGVVGCGLIGWFAQPLFMALTGPLVLVYYLSAHRHPLWWHLPLALGLAAAVGLNAFWLQDWVAFWWVRVPPCLEGTSTPVGLAAVCETCLWGDRLDRGIAVATAIAGITGSVILYLSGKRPAGRVLGLGTLGLSVLVVCGTKSHVLGRLGACQLLMAALLFASVPAAYAVFWVLGWLRPRDRVGVTLALAAVLPLVAWIVAPNWAARYGHPEPLAFGLGEERSALVAAVREKTGDEARVLWEDRHGESRWAALLPVLTGRAFVGGLDDGTAIEHATCGLVEGTLAGRPLGQYSDSELADYCRRYNVGWVVCGDGSKERLARWPAAGKPERLATGRWLFRIERQPSFALAGKATWRSADARGILLADVTPERVSGEDEGQVLLSLHYQAGMRVSPSRVRIEKAVSTHDNVPFVRLRMKEPVGRVLITWEGR